MGFIVVSAVSEGAEIEPECFCRKGHFCRKAASVDLYEGEMRTVNECIIPRRAAAEHVRKWAIAIVHRGRDKLTD